MTKTWQRFEDLIKILQRFYKILLKIDKNLTKSWQKFDKNWQRFDRNFTKIIQNLKTISKKKGANIKPTNYHQFVDNFIILCLHFVNNLSTNWQ